MAVCSHCNKIGNKFFSYLDLSSACLNMLTLRSVNLIYFMVWSVGLVKTNKTFNSAVNVLGHNIVWEEDNDTKYMVTVL